MQALECLSVQKYALGIATSTMIQESNSRDSLVMLQWLASGDCCWLRLLSTNGTGMSEACHCASQAIINGVLHHLPGDDRRRRRMVLRVVHRVGQGLVGKVTGHKLYDAWQIVQVRVGQQSGAECGADQLAHSCLVLGGQEQGPAWFNDQPVSTALSLNKLMPCAKCESKRVCVARQRSAGKGWSP